MQSYSRTLVSVVGTVLMVLGTVLLAAWSHPQPPAQPPNSAAVSVSVLR